MDYTIPEFKASTVDEGFGPEDTNTKELYKEVEAFARHGQPILIFGPTGAGKEFLARHYYNTLLKSEFFGQYRDNWPLKFEEIISEYSKHYSKKEIEIFINSIRTGVFESINSATIYPTLAESILFGHEANLFNDSRTSPGLLESIKHGVLFMDEIGDRTGGRPGGTDRREQGCGRAIDRPVREDMAAAADAGRREGNCRGPHPK